MRLPDDELEYRERYAHLPSDQDELLDYLRRTLKLNPQKVKEEEERIKNIKWETVKIDADTVPKGTPRPKYSSVSGTFYVKGAKKTKRYFQKIIKDNNIICTRVEYSLIAYMPTPVSSMTNTEIYLAEKGLIRPPTTADWDNLAKTYTDCLQDVLLLNDNIINPGHVYKYYSIKPRLEIELHYMTDFDSKYQKRKVLSSSSYKKYIENGYILSNGVLRQTNEV